MPIQANQNYLAINNSYTIFYDEENCYLNDSKTLIDTGGLSAPRKTPEEACLDLQKNFYEQFFKKYIKNVVVLSAAGTSMENGSKCGKSREQLWEFAKKEIESLADAVGDPLKNKEFYKNKNIEHMLSYVLLYEQLSEDNTSIKEKRKDIQDKIKEACSLQLEENSPHVQFLNKITARKSNASRVQIYTTNYDTLFEQAANKGGFVVIDGFSFTQPRTFSGRNFDFDFVYREKTRVKNEESFISKVFHLYKLHGSLNWEKQNELIIQKDTDDPLIIYPASNKYESSYEQPYFEMMSRFQQALRQEDVLLIIIGFGFEDKHIQSVIMEAVEQNPSFRLAIINYNSNKKGIDIKNLEMFFNDVDNLKIKNNVSIVFDKYSAFAEKYPTNQTYLEESNK